MQCTINLTLQYMVIFVALGICRSWLDFQNVAYESSAVQKALKHASETVFYAPMACLMFVDFRMRVLQLTKGQGNPQEFVQLAMQAVAYSILANTVMVLIIPVFLNCDTNDVELDKNTGELKTDGKNPFENAILAMTFTAIRYACFLALYVGFGAVVYGLFTFEPDPNVWQGPVPEVSPAVFCTCLLACAFFSIYCLLAVSHTYSQFVKGARGTSKFEEAMLCGADTLALAPMLCTLFLGARMRALQMDPIGGNPQGWAQSYFYACTYALFTQCLLAICVPLVLNDVLGVEAKVRRGTDENGEKLCEGDLQVDMGQGVMSKVFTAARWLIMLSVYAGAVAVVCSVFTIEHPKGKQYTPQVSPTMQCVINLSFQYFFIYVLLWVFYTVKHFSGTKSLDWIRDAVESAKSTVQFAPMLAVLFIATRMRALQITQNAGSPQGYVQDGMYLATWSVLVQFLMCLVMPFFTGEKYNVESLAGSDKPVKQPEIKNAAGAWTVTIIRYLALVSLLGGVAAVITGVFLITPENANGSGSIPLVGEHVSAPPAATDIPYMKEGMDSTGKTIGGGVDTVNGARDATTGVIAGGK